MGTPPQVPVPLVRAVERVRVALGRLHQNIVPAPFAMLETIQQSWVTQAIFAAAKLGRADTLAPGPLGATDIANRVNASPDGIERLLRVLVSRGIFAHDRDGRYSLNRMADCLRSDAPTSVRPFALFIGSPQHWEHWAHLTDSVVSGEVSVPAVRGKPFFDYLEDDREFASVFNAAMTSLSELAEAPVCAAYDFSAYATIVDVGGGHGRFLAATLRNAPSSEGVLFDLPSVVADAPAVLSRHGVTERVTIVGGSFFDSVPVGGDLYVLKLIIHDWAPDQARRILRTIRAAMKPASRLALVEAVIPDNDDHFIGKLVDLEMLLSVGGRERTEHEYAELLAECGLEPTQVVRTASPMSVIEARPV